MTCPYEIIDHVAAVRPTPRRFLTHCKLHAEYPQLGVINGLGSKGALVAPAFAIKMYSLINL